MKIYNIPIENLEIRYSSQWNKWFPEYYIKNNIDYEDIYGDELTKEIEQGSFLDVCGTNYFKASQLQKIIKFIYENKIQDNDILLFHDLWFPGLEMLQYIRQGMNKKFKIAGLLHAGTWDEHDFLFKSGMEPWAKEIENGWFNFVDKIFVATNFHKELLLNKRKIINDKIIVTGFPIFNEFEDNSVIKENIVVFPHRLNDEKNPQLFDKLKNDCKEIKNWKFIKSMEICHNKKEYYNLLNRSKIAVSFADQETWGIAMQEALFCNCIPLVPNKLSYSEMYDSFFKFDSYEQCLVKLSFFIKNDINIENNKKRLIDFGKNSINNIIGNLLCP